MSTFWRFRAWLHHQVSKVVWLLLAAAIVLVGYFLREPLLAIWTNIDNAMGF
jgi:hypothetical protein